MRVRAKQLPQATGAYAGYYNLVRRKPGEVFDLLDPSDFSPKWMEKVDGNTPKTEAPGEPKPGELPRKGKRKGHEPAGNTDDEPTGNAEVV